MKANVRVAGKKDGWVERKNDGWIVDLGFGLQAISADLNGVHWYWMPGGDRVARDLEKCMEDAAGFIVAKECIADEPVEESGSGGNFI